MPSAQLTGNATPPAQDHAGDCDPIPAPADEGVPVPMSLDCDATDRTFDRQLAHPGLLDDAAPLFRDGFSVPDAGARLGLPCLVESGLFRISRKLYGEIGPAIYGLQRVVLQGLPPGVRNHGHAELGAEMLGIGRYGGDPSPQRALQGMPLEQNRARNDLRTFKLARPPKKAGGTSTLTTRYRKSSSE